MTSFASSPSAADASLTQDNRLTPPRKNNSWFGHLFQGEWMRWSQKIPQHLLVLPSDNWPGNAGQGKHIIAGQFNFAGQSFPTTQWMPDHAHPDWLRQVHSFDWLRDLRAVGGDAARRTARNLVLDWLSHYRRWDAKVWQPDLIGWRLASWINFHDFFLASADDRFRTQVFESMVKQSRYLARILPGHMRGARLISALKGQIYACLALPNSQSRLFNALTILADELPRQILPDGGHIERNPTSHALVLRHLIDIRAALRAAGFAVPDIIQHSIHVMAPVLRLYRHADGKMALFNGSEEGDAAWYDVLLNQSHAGNRTAISAPHTGYERLQQGRSVVLIDTGAPPPPSYDHNAHAAPLAFEFSVGRERIFVNCGHAGQVFKASPLSSALRTTAAHSTVVIADTNAVELRNEGGIGRHPRQMRLEHQQDAQGKGLAITHDGYQSNLNIFHTRQILLSSDGEDLSGADILQGPAGYPFIIRFHLHPDTKASVTGNGATILLRTRSGAGWRFRAHDASVVLEESLYLANAADAPQRTQQIIIAGHSIADETIVSWQLKREKKTRPSTKDMDDLV
jgi:uncharacterized heparinase superfamily protein